MKEVMICDSWKNQTSASTIPLFNYQLKHIDDTTISLTSTLIITFT